MWQSNGLNTTYMGFNPGEPNGGVNENCLAMWVENGNWQDDVCLNTYSYNLCEKPMSQPSPNPTIIQCKFILLEHLIYNLLFGT
jgi:hypothetical protein